MLRPQRRAALKAVAAPHPHPHHAASKEEARVAAIAVGPLHPAAEVARLPRRLGALKAAVAAAVVAMVAEIVAGPRPRAAAECAAHRRPRRGVTAAEAVAVEARQLLPAEEAARGEDQRLPVEDAVRPRHRTAVASKDDDSRFQSFTLLLARRASVPAVPLFFRWIASRWPCIVLRLARLPHVE